ncbi:DUF2341 domain-containing protein [Candidatus Bathyarchaeota archaeon A05DMB-2]|jgi:hypothetical protein|nr:DUF2341 domain-containing protein [Candidatus Bathyarchaeota archaeon A05DMB-2]
MAKGRSPLFSEIRKGFEQADIRTRINRTIEIATHRIPSDRRSEKQLKVRDAYKKCVNVWRGLSAEEKLDYEEQARASRLNISGWNYFVKLKLPEYIVSTWKVNITNNVATQLTDYPVLVNLTNATAFFEACEDRKTSVRVYGADKTTPLSYWIEKWDTTAKTAWIWIKIPSLPAGGTATAYIKLDPEQTQTAENPSGVFTLFDDFESYPEGANINGLGGWETLRVGGSGEAKVRTYNGRKHLRLYSTSDNTTVTHSCTLTNTGVAFRGFTWITNPNESNTVAFSDRSITSRGEALNGYSLIIDGWGNTYTRLYRWVNGSGVLLGGTRTSSPSNIYRLHELTWYGNTFRALIDGNVLFTGSDSYYSSRTYLMLYNYSGCDKSYDYVLVRKYVYPEPSVTVQLA